MVCKIKFNYHDFEDYLFAAISESRNLVCDDMWVEYVKRYLGLAISEVDLFVAQVKNNKEEEGK